MTGTVPNEYRSLALDSSNEMMEYDSRWVLGRYPEAAWHILQAGTKRVRMGQLMFADGNFTQAGADWLSAAECFYLSTDLERMRDALDRVRRLDQEGKIPPDRRDIHTAFKEQEEQINTLVEKLNRFRQDFSRGSGQEALDWLLGQVRELPGFPNLHAAITQRAMRLGQLRLSLHHLEWAEKFAPRNPDLGALRTALLIAAGQPDRAIQFGRELLKSNPGMDHLRVLIAQTLAFRPGASRADWEEAIEVLRPVQEGGSGDATDRLVPLALAVTLQHGIGYESEYRRLLRSFDQLAETNQLLGEHIVTGLRQALPQVFPQPKTKGIAPSPGEPIHSTHPDYSAVARIFRQFNPLTAGIAA